MLTTNQSSANVLAYLLLQHGVKDIFLSPGTRNAPLIMAVSRFDSFRIYNVVDERSAAFMALGMASQKRRPVAVICTSGTAVLNYAPAVAEAFYKNIPLIVISADRPQEWIGQNDGQTIRQHGILSHIVKDFYDIPVPGAVQDYDWYVNRTVNSALLTAMSAPTGPLHINIQFETPLSKESDLLFTKEQLRVIRNFVPKAIFERNEVKTLISDFIDKRIMVVAGFGSPDDKLNRALKRLSSCPNVVVVAEAQSNIKGLDSVVDNIDGVLASFTPDDYSSFAPDLVISIGGSILSQGLKNLLRNRSTLSVWNLGYSGQQTVIDCFMHLSDNILALPAPFLNTLASVLKHSPADNGYAKIWNERCRVVEIATQNYIENAPWSDMKAVDCLIRELPDNINFHVSNGLSVRYLQSTDYSRLHRIECNRGCSGIDGSTSTALGGALGSNHPTVLLTGDMSARYDLIALSSGLVPSRFSVFVLNNGGGEIFRAIDNTRHLAERETHIAMASNFNFKGFAEASGFKYLEANSTDQIIDICRDINKERDKPLFVEIYTQQAPNAETFRNYFHLLKKLQNEN